MVTEELKVRAVTVTQQTLVPLGVVSGIAVGLFNIYVNYDSREVAQEALLLSLQNQITANKAAIDKPDTNRFTCTEHENWTLRLQALNPNLRMPRDTRRCEP